ncbi:MAG: hypothetical protein KO464_02270 [Candidatus Methanofastidiosum sp.]|nr:hypothetical protein [Methanofastidiosum sp.]
MTTEKIKSMNFVVKTIATLVIGLTTTIGAGITLHQIRKGEDPSGSGKNGGV